MTRTNKMQASIIQVRDGQVTRQHKRDVVVTEEPLEIRLIAGRHTRQLAVTMRTPGNDLS